MKKETVQYKKQQRAIKTILRDAERYLYSKIPKPPKFDGEFDIETLRQFFDEFKPKVPQKKWYDGIMKNPGVAINTNSGIFVSGP
jgi:hypothetical protein